MTSHQIVSSAILSHARLAPTGAQTHGARYAHKRYSFSCFSASHLVKYLWSYSFTNSLKVAGYLWCFCTGEVTHSFSTFTFNLHHFLLPLWYLRLVSFLSRHSESSFLLQLDGEDTLTCNMQKSTTSQNTSVTAVTIRTFFLSVLVTIKLLLSLVLVFEKFRITLYHNQS